MLVFEKIGENFDTTIFQNQGLIKLFCEICTYKILPYDIIFFIEQI
jgi:hypothetical protein